MTITLHSHITLFLTFLLVAHAVPAPDGIAIIVSGDAAAANAAAVAAVASSNSSAVVITNTSSTYIVTEETVVAQLLTDYPDLKAYSPLLNSTHLSKLAAAYVQYPPNRTNYWTREEVMIDYLSRLPAELKANLPVPIGFRELHPDVRQKIASIFYASPREGISYWDKVITVAHFIQKMVPEVVTFQVNSTIQLKGQYSRADLTNMLTGSEFSEVDKLQRNRQITDDDRDYRIGVILRKAYRRDPNPSTPWPPMHNWKHLPPRVQTAIRYVWFDERLLTDHRPLLAVFKDHIAPHIIPKEFVGKEGQRKVCVFVPEEKAKQHEAIEAMNEVYKEKAALFTFGNVGDKVTIQHPQETPTTTTLPQLP